MDTRVISKLVVLVLLTLARPGAAAINLEQIMADPDWIGPPVEAAWWQWDGQSYVYQVKRSGSQVREFHRVELDSGNIRRVETDETALLDTGAPIFNRDRTRALFVRDGKLFLRDYASGTLRPLATGPGAVLGPAFAADQSLVHYRIGSIWRQLDLATGAARSLTDLRLEEAPFKAMEAGLEAEQLRLFPTLERERQWQQQQHEQAVAEAQADGNRDAAPWYLSAGMEIADSALSADGRWLLAVVQKAGDDNGRQDKMPRFVTRSGYVEIEDVRTLVGRDAATPQRLWLLDLDNRAKHELPLDTLNGLDRDPLAELKQVAEIKPHDKDRPRLVRVSGIRWHPTDAIALVQLRAIDNKDRWTIRVAASDQKIDELHRLTDSAWINWTFNEFGWIPGSRNAWLLSEESGFSHLYAIAPQGRKRALTRGEFEVFDVSFDADGQRVFMLSNRAHPTEYDLYRLDLGDGRLTRLSELKGVESYRRHPTTGDILLRHSDSYLPIQASVLKADGARVAATDTRTARYRAVSWQAPEFVGIPSSHVQRPIWTKFYPASDDFPGKRPVVVFVHGAGYTQNTHHRFPYYFREQMFHNLLTERGYHVIDMDYRASRGYGRDWRTAIYRQMGKPELEDLIDGVEWLVRNHNADPQRVGIYGGSYGGFMTFIAMFKAPEVFAAGASLRPVTDWVHYNHGYTSNILNTPQVDPEAYRRSSPIEFAENFNGHLLISHGMLDDNVFYKDSVRLVQRLIELKKQNWEFASYPLEPHGYVHPESWLDQYRRILKLFETTIGD